MTYRQGLSVLGVIVIRTSCAEDSEIDRLDRSSQSCDAGVESSQRMRKKSSRSMESIVRPCSRVS